ncbi:MAG: DUF4911 domain-containing protein [Deltaproteobacteria bacterium]|nr:DUF4911 domain-containing protein [Deltaproteobacteria bacterium]
MKDPFETHKLYLRINARRIYFFKFLLEGYDGMATLSTVDVRTGLVLLRYPMESQRVLFELLADLVESISPKS